MEFALQRSQVDADHIGKVDVRQRVHRWRISHIAQENHLEIEHQGCAEVTERLKQPEPGSVIDGKRQHQGERDQTERRRSKYFFHFALLGG